MSLFETQQKPCICMCSPHRKFLTKDGRTRLDTITLEWQRARQLLHQPTNINYYELFADGMEVGVARSMVAAEVCRHKPEPPEFVFFLDDDVIPNRDSLVKLFFRARVMPQYDIYGGVYVLKRPEVQEPLVYGENGQGPIWDWAVGDILTTESHGVKSIHMGLTLIRTSLFQRMLEAEVDCHVCKGELTSNGRKCKRCEGKGKYRLVGGDGADKDNEPFFLTQEEDTVKNGAVARNLGTEDIYFCTKAMRVGAKILVDTSVLAGHQDKASGIIYGLPNDYGPAQRAKWIPRDGGSIDQREAEKKGVKLALDLGAGGMRRQWPGHVTYTTDLRKDSGADYVQDTLWLNMPDNHYDLVASSHHLEHLGRWDQDRAWTEIFRVCKPGGRCEHVVPSIEWAAAKLAAGEADQYVYDVLYGAQEGFGYDRQFNMHFFGYTKAVAQALAEVAGFINVNCIDWRDNPQLGFHLIITGDKPGREPVNSDIAKGVSQVCQTGSLPSGQAVRGQDVQVADTGPAVDGTSWRQDTVDIRVDCGVDGRGTNEAVLLQGRGRNHGLDRDGVEGKGGNQ